MCRGFICAIHNTVEPQFIGLWKQWTLSEGGQQLVPVIDFAQKFNEVSNHTF